MWEVRTALDGIEYQGRSVQEAVRNNTACVLQILGAAVSANAVFPRPWDQSEEPEDAEDIGMTYEELMAQSEKISGEINGLSSAVTA